MTGLPYPQVLDFPLQYRLLSPPLNARGEDYNHTVMRMMFITTNAGMRREGGRTSVCIKIPRSDTNEVGEIGVTVT